MAKNNNENDNKMKTVKLSALLDVGELTEVGVNILWRKRLVEEKSSRV
jgi:hypothetical protein